MQFTGFEFIRGGGDVRKVSLIGCGRSCEGLCSWGHIASQQAAATLHLVFLQKRIPASRQLSPSETLRQVATTLTLLQQPVETELFLKGLLYKSSKFLCVSCRVLCCDTLMTVTSMTQTTLIHAVS